MNILLIEDNEADQRAMKEAFKTVCKDAVLKIAGEADEAMRLIACQGEGAPQACPDLILLDLNLPGAGGRDLLREIKSNPETQATPVIVFTSSAFPEDINECYKLGANSYITKPMRYAELLRLVGLINDFWLKEVKFPQTR